MNESLFLFPLEELLIEPVKYYYNMNGKNYVQLLENRLV